MGVTLGVGTEKGGFVLRREAGRWQPAGPLFPGWKVTAFGSTPGGDHLAAVASNWFGAALHRSPDLAAWEQVEGPTHQEGRSLQQVWTLTRHGDEVLAGVAEAGVFAADPAWSWRPLDALNRFPGWESWSPGLGGLAAHRILTDGRDRIWVAISAAGVFRSDDGGATFTRADAGIAPVVEELPDGFCVHGLAHDPGRPDLIWRQDHSGVYRSEDGGGRWDRIEEGLPARFGFVMLRDHASGSLFVVPLEADASRIPVEGRFRAYRSTDGGESWHASGRGWPEAPTYDSVLRGAAAGDGDGGIFLGTTGGRVWVSEDAGDRWEALPFTFPRILTVAVLGAG